MLYLRALVPPPQLSQGNCLFRRRCSVVDFLSAKIMSQNTFFFLINFPVSSVES